MVHVRLALESLKLFIFSNVASNWRFFDNVSDYPYLYKGLSLLHLFQTIHQCENKWTYSYSSTIKVFEFSLLATFSESFHSIDFTLVVNEL